MQLASRVSPDAFHDGGTDTEPPDPTRPPVVELVRVTPGGVELWRLGRRIAYRDATLGVLLVPADLTTFTTDLTSVPTLFTWLVPRTGRHLPAALLHDGLVHPPGTPATYLSAEGRVVDRVTADRVFRDAMRDSRTAVVRRWLVWSAVTLATTWSGSAGWSRLERLRRRAVMVLTLGVVAVLGVVATLDLVDVVDVLPWMGERPWWLELVGGASAAVVVPLLLGLAWGRFRVAGVITAVALALLLHVTVVLALLTAVYQLAEAVVRRSPATALALAAAVVATAAVVTVVLVA